MKTIEEILMAPLTRNEIEVRRHGYYPTHLLEGREGRTVVTWGYRLSCALPKADIIAFWVPGQRFVEAGLALNDGPANLSAIIEVSWDGVVHVLGERWERCFNRYCVRPKDFPTPEELQTLMKHMVSGS